MEQPANDPGKYRVERTPDGHVQLVVRAFDGMAVPLDQESQDYCDFLGWAVNQTPPIAKTYDGLEAGDYFTDEHELIRHCIDNGILLHAHWTDADHAMLTIQPPPSGGNSVIYLSHGGRGGEAVFYRLHTPIAPKERTSLVEDVNATTQWEPLMLWVSVSLLNRLNEKLVRADEDIRCLSSLPVQKAFVYLDVSDFSKHPSIRQAMIINAIIQLTHYRRRWENSGVITPEAAFDDREASLCIGDGYIFVFKRSWHALFFAAYLAYMLEAKVAKGEVPELHFRISVHVGLVYRFWDESRDDWNYVGDGIIAGQRVLSAIGPDQDDVVFVSGETRQDLRRYVRQGDPDAFHWMQNRGRRADKHGQLRRLYELNHIGLVESRVDRQWIRRHL